MSTFDDLTARAFGAAVAGTHAFVLVDMDAPMHTMDLESHRPKVRMSPDVWRRIMSAPSPLLEPLSVSYVPLADPPEPGSGPFTWPYRPRT